MIFEKVQKATGNDVINEASRNDILINDKVNHVAAWQQNIKEVY